jgi:hypothetical protein
LRENSRCRAAAEQAKEELSSLMSPFANGETGVPSHPGLLKLLVLEKSEPNPVGATIVA